MEVNAEIQIEGMTCDACVKTISRALNSVPGVKSVSVEIGKARVAFDPETAKVESLHSSIREKGYRIPGDHSRNQKFSSFFSSDAFSLERESLWSGVYSFALMGLATLFIYLGFLRGIPNFEARYSLFIIFFLASLAISNAALHYVTSIRSKVTCMTGCMGGMTIGMVSGFTLGAVIGATNGMLIGSLYGLAAGIAMGAAVGKCCGTMGIMEGMMAGLMGGVMGAMTTLMMITENVFIFLGILISISGVMLAGLVKLFRAEARQSVPQSHYKLLIISLAVVLFTLWLIAFGPRSIVVASITTSWGA